MPLLFSTLLALLLVGCSYFPERVHVAYQPTVIEKQHKLITHAGKVDVYVSDNRRGEKGVISRKTGEHGVEYAAIRLEGNLAGEIGEAVKIELGHLGFTPVASGSGDKTVEVDIQKFFNEFKPGAFGGRAIAEVIFGVNVRKKSGEIFYSKTIIGIGEMQSVWRHSGKNAKIALEGALNDAMNKLLNDQAFLQALEKA